jgi:carbamoyl-phosphate synthase large subunit
MRNILITAIGGDIAQSAAKIVKNCFPQWRIYGVDKEARHGGRLFVDCFDIGPSAADARYIAWLRRFISENNISYCLPMSEPELARLAELGEQDPLMPLLLWSGIKSVKIGCDKLATAEFIRTIGLPVPWTLLAEAAVVPPSFPCVFKLRRSSGSKSVYVCENIDEVHFFRQRNPEAVVQEFLANTESEVTCAVFRSNSGEVSVLQLQRRLVGGFTGWAKVIEDRQVLLQCCRVAEALEVVGCFNVQLRLTDAGPRIFEINPRLSSTLWMRYLAGFRDLVWMLQDVLGEPYTVYCPAKGLEMVRLQDAAVLSSNVSDKR